MTTFHAYRIAEAYPPCSFINIRDDLMHLVPYPQSFQTVCGRDVANLTLLRFKDFGRHDSEVKWCQACALWLKRREAEEYRDDAERARGGQFRLSPETVRQLRCYVGDGMKITAACRALGIAVSTAKRALRRNLAVEAIK